MSKYKPIKITNTVDHKKVPFQTLKEGEVKYYSCGPTVYDFLHIGNARAQVISDLIHRVLKALGYKVKFVSNFTDVDDKILLRAEKDKMGALEVAKRFEDEALIDMQALNLLPADVRPRVSESIEDIIAIIESLIEKKYAYVVDGEVLYSVPSFQEYGKLAHLKLDELEHGIRVEVDSHKRSPNDFVLWKPAKANEISWDSPWGKGRPGWHIECSGMIKKHLGETIDLHHGGIDLIFPHHENEIAQSEAANGKVLSNYWCHHEFVNFTNEKMSKSLGNVITIRDFTNKYGGEILRYMMISTHYRTKLEWSEDLVDRALSELERIHQFLMEFPQIKIDDERWDLGKENALYPIYSQILDHLADDFNTPEALAEVFSLIRTVRREGEVDEVGLSAIFSLVKAALGIIYQPKVLLEKLNQVRAKRSQASSVDVKVIEDLIEARIVAKKNKDWAAADEIRKKLIDLKIELQDSPDGKTHWKYQ